MSPTDLDPVTERVRALYEEYPYPSGAPVVRLGFDARLVLSRARLERPGGRPIRVLDAGCSRGVGTLAAASLQPDVEFTGVDVNRVALAEARAAARRRGLANARFAEVDLMTLEGLDVPDGGFDVIQSSGVVHHLSDPARGLALLGRALAPWGVLALMVYGRLGRAPIHRVAAAIDALAGELPDGDLAARLALGRELCRALADPADAACPWREALACDDVEFVDRYLHPQEAAYSVDELCALVEGAGLAHLGWAEPARWEAGALPPGPLRERAAALDARARWRLVERVVEPRKLEVLLGRPGNGPRPAPAERELEGAVLAVHPEARIEVATRGTWRGTRVEEVRVAVRGGAAEALPPGPLAAAALVLREQADPFRGAELVGHLHARGVGAAAARRAVAELLRRELLYAPHPVEVGAPATV